MRYVVFISILNLPINKSIFYFT